MPPANFLSTPSSVLPGPFLGRDLFAFLLALSKYFIRKITFLGNSFRGLFLFFLRLASDFKFLTLRKLIWGRGRLGRPIAHAAVFGLSWGVFLMGGLMSGTSLVRSETYELDILSAENSSDVAFGLTGPRGGDILASTQLEPQEYLVQEGDTLSSIGQQFKVTVDTLISANNIGNSDYLRPGQKLLILPISGVEYTVKSGDTLQSIASAYKLPTQAVVDINYIDEPYTLQVGQKLILPGASILPPAPAETSVSPRKVVVPGSVPAYPVPPTVDYAYRPELAGMVVGDANFVWPTNRRYITQYFSYYHPAIDIAIESPIYAIDSGVVIGAGWRPGGFGNTVEVDHGNGYRSFYAHFQAVYVSVGDTVAKGQALGMMGTTGRSTGVHLHLMISKDGSYIDPLSVL